MTVTPLHYLTPAQVDKKIAEQEGKIARLRAQLEREERALKPLTDEYKARGGWTRAYLVNNADGHVHSSAHCKTCRWTTQFQWLTDLSGQSQDEIVAAAGELACTVCYPDAPVEVTSKPGTLRTDHQLAQEQRAKEKAERDAAKKAKGITAPDGSKLVVGPHRETPGTERAARILLGQFVRDAIWYRAPDSEGDVTPHPYEPQWIDGAKQLADAIVHKAGGATEDLFEEALVKAAKKTTSEYRKQGLDTTWVEAAVAGVSAKLES